MERYLSLLKSVSLFHGMEESELQPLLSCLEARLARFEKNQVVFPCGEPVKSFGIVLSGQVRIVQEDYYGNRSILTNAGAGSLFAESFACADAKTLPVSILATAESDILFIDCHRLVAPCTNACSFHSRLIQNMLNIIAIKNIALTQKIEITSRRTTREKLLAYLSAEAQAAKHSRFSIPFNRQELADYLSVDRSAMSAELSRMRDDGILRFDKNRFELL